MFIVILYLNCACRSISVKGTIYVHLKTGILHRVDQLGLLVAQTVKGLSKRAKTPQYFSPTHVRKWVNRHKTGKEVYKDLEAPYSQLVSTSSLSPLVVTSNPSPSLAILWTKSFPTFLLQVLASGSCSPQVCKKEVLGLVF